MLRDNLRVFSSRIPPPSPIAEREYTQIRRRANVLSVTSSFIRNLMINYVPRLPVSAAQHFLKKLIFPRISIELSPAVPTPHKCSSGKLSEFSIFRVCPWILDILSRGLLISWVKNYAHNRGFFTCFLHRELHALKSLKPAFWLTSNLAY